MAVEGVNPCGRKWWRMDYDSIDYFDILILGRSGTGNRIATNKLLLANPTGEDYEIATEEEVIVSPNVSHFDIFSAWHLSGEQDMKIMTSRLTHLAFWRSLGEVHKLIIDEQEKRISTKCLELLSNDISRIRVLNTPELYGSNNDDDSDSDHFIQSHPLKLNEPSSRPKSSHFNIHEYGAPERDMSFMRKIWDIKVATNFKLNRIVYFLPDTGVLTRISCNLKNELQVMKQYFGHTIFYRMVVVATYHRSVYRFVREGCDIFTETDIEVTRATFRNALSQVLHTNEAPDPPVIFISLYDSCDEVLRKIKDAEVIQEGVEIRFTNCRCAHCGSDIANTPDHMERLDNTAIAKDDPEAVSIPCESMCHPMFIPKYSTSQRVISGIVSLLALNMFSTTNTEDEMCINCGQPPKSRGCLRVGTTFVHENTSIIVNHKYDKDKNYL